MIVKVFTEAVFKECEIYYGINLSYAVTCTEIVDGSRCITTSSETAEN